MNGGREREDKIAMMEVEKETAAFAWSHRGFLAVLDIFRDEVVFDLSFAHFVSKKSTV